MTTHKNRVKCAISNTPGSSGALTLSTAETGYRTLGASDDGLSFDVVIEDGTAWEVRTGCVYTHSGTSLARGTLEDSSTGSAITLTSAAVVTVTATADFGRRMESAALNHVAGTDANTTMVAGNLYVVDMSAWATADRTYTLPATAAVGDRVGVMVSVGNTSTFELVLTAASGDTLNGVVGGTEWSRLFITGEVVIMRCVAANATWVVEYDGRLPSSARLEDGTATSLSHATFTKISVDSEVFDNGAIGDPTTNNRVTVRRAGVYAVSAMANIANADADTRVVVRVYVNGSAAAELARSFNRLVGGTAVGSGAVTLSCSADDYVELYALWSVSGGSGSKSTDNSSGARPYLAVSEVL